MRITRAILLYVLLGVIAYAIVVTANAATDPRLSAIAGLRVDCAESEIANVTGIAGATINGYYSPSVPSMVESVIVGWTEPRIVLAPQVCKRMMFTNYDRHRARMLRRSWAWQIFAHEVAHSRGYDHGAATIGADCAAVRHFMRPLLRAYGVRSMYAKRLTRLQPNYC